MKNTTVFEKIIYDCRRAMLSGKPLIVLRTNEMELVRQIVESDRLVAPPVYENYCEIIDEPYPDLNEIRDCLFRCEFLQDPQKASAVDKIANALLGLLVMQVKRLIGSLANMPNRDELFDPECYDDDNLNGLLNGVFSANKRFVIGADITKIVNMALQKIWNRSGVTAELISIFEKP